MAGVNADLKIQALDCQTLVVGGSLVGQVAATITSTFTNTTSAAGDGATFYVVKSSGSSATARLYISKFTATVNSAALAPVATGLAGTAWAPSGLAVSQCLGLVSGDSSSNNKLYRLMMDENGNIRITNMTGILLSASEKFTLLPCTLTYRLV